jgi:GTPase SAR1 family protein
VTQAQAEDKLVKKLLLLGAGESGKSTLFKQAQALYCAPYTPQEIKSYIPTIHNNIVQNIKTLIKFSSELKPPCPIKPANIKYKAVMDEVPMHCTSLTPQHAQAVTALWADEGIRATYTRRSEYQLNDSTAYFFQRVNDVVQPGYMPNNQDILRSRARTTGIVETTFVVEGKTFKMYDVGGQRNERKKWIHCFENVTALLFVAAISEYDQKLYEDETQNRMSETLSLFEEIVKCVVFFGGSFSN